jgi:anti-sigma regulatory factor (Ser/Thr protein kinase)
LSAHSAGRKVLLEIAVAADSKEFRAASERLAKACSSNGIPDEALWKLDVCLNEALANVVTHRASAAAPPAVTLRLDLELQADRAAAMLTVTDSGKSFNPLDHVTRPHPTCLEDAEPGGLGIAMMRTHADRMSYRFRDGRNELSFEVCWQV